MSTFRRTIVLATAMIVGVSASQAQVTVKIGVLTDQTGALSDASGEGSVVAARLAIEDFQAENHGIRIELIAADHQNKPDVALAIARGWIDLGGVDVIADVPGSAVALAVSDLVRVRNKVLLVSGSGTSDLTGKACSPNTIHWTYDTWADANGVATALVKEGFDSWYFVTADYAFGKALQADTTKAVTRAAGRVVGDVQTPFPTADFSSALLLAAASDAKVIALATGGTDTINAVKQAAEFGVIGAGRKLVVLLLGIPDLHAIGVEAAQGLIFTTASYWDLNDGTREFSRRFAAQRGGLKPGDIHMGVYGSVMHYLRAVAALNDKDPARVLAQMRAMPTQDPLFGAGRVRADGRAVHAMYLAEVKTPGESRGPWDLVNILATIPAEQAFRPLQEGGCALVPR